MLIDRSHKPWLIFSVVALVASTAVYLAYAALSAGGPRGGSAIGLAFGIVGTLFIWFSAFLGVRKKRPHYRIGRASTWLKGHLWLGALSMPLILFHGGFSFGGPLTRTLMWVFVLVYVTGVLGLLLQQFLPRLMTNALPQETVYEQIDHVREQLLEEIVKLARGVPARRGAVSRPKRMGRVRGRIVESRAAVETREDEPDRGPIRDFVDRHMRRYFAKKRPWRSPLWGHHTRAALFEELARVCDPGLRGVVSDLEAYCAQREQLELQRRMHLWLHGWLLVHVPLAWTMVFLSALHAVMSLYY